MTGPEHYHEAEEAIRAAEWQRQEWGERDGASSRDAMESSRWELARAQVHATLALRDELAAFRRELVNAVSLVPGAMP